MSKREQRRFSIFARRDSNKPPARQEEYVTWKSDREDKGIQGNLYKEAFKDLLLIAAPFISSYIGYELGGIIGTGVGAASGLACSMYYLYRYY